MEFGLGLCRGFRGTNNLDCLTRIAEKLTTFMKLESAVGAAK
jgi:hypothetical protein